MCHIHYPAISTMVAETCHAFALPVLPDGPVGHGGALSLFEDDGEKAQRCAIPPGTPPPPALIATSPGQP